MMTFSEALDNHLYGGGMQAEEPEECYRCGCDIGDDAIEVNGEKYCDTCHRMIVRAYRLDIHRQIGSYLKESDPFRCYCIKEALEEYAEEFDE